MEKTLKVFESIITFGLFVLFIIELHEFATTDNVVSGVWAVLLLIAGSNIGRNTKIKVTVGERK
ncbi:UPF0716 family protein affecting phage T7 exclusion [Lysinibacillus sp. TE18511]